MKSLVGYAKLSLVAASLLLMVPVVASAAQSMGRDMPIFESFDLNKNGTLTESEMKEARALRAKEREEAGKILRNKKNHYEFSDIDSNKDGVVDKEEFKTHQQKRIR